MNNTIGIILFARMSSSRLPGKMLRPIGSTTLLERVVKRARLLDRPLLLATSIDATDDVLVAAAEPLDLPVYRGSLNDVLGRACAAAQHAGFVAFARLCGDRPFLPLEDMRQAICMMEAGLYAVQPPDLITSMLPAPVPSGMMTEVIRTGALVSVLDRVSTDAEREHVTTHFYQHPDQYHVISLHSPLQQLPPAHCSVDTEADWRLLAEVIQRHPSLDFPEQAAVQAVWSLASYASTLDCPS